MAATPQPFPAGHRLGPYELVALIGRGGFGEVYRARDVRLKREVAIKCVRGSLSHGDARRLELEARATAALNHPNIVSIYDVGFDDELVYIVMELLSGESLRSRMRRGRLSADVSVNFASQIVEALTAAHAKGIIHRDLKPENVFVLTGERIKVLDFGIAKVSDTAPGADDEETRSALTRAGAIIGTPAYLAPEQARSLAVDQRTDIFSFGIVFYEMLSGLSPFRGASHADTMMAILRDEPPPLRDTATPPAVVRIIERCLAKEPAARFQTTADLRFALDAAAPAATRRTSRPRRSLLAGIAAALVVGLAAVAWRSGVLERFSRATDPPDAIQRTTVDVSQPLDRLNIGNVFPNQRVSINALTPTHLEVSAPAPLLSSVMSVLKLVDALSHRRFVDEPAAVRFDNEHDRVFPLAGQSDLRVSLSVQGASTSGLLQAIAVSTRWPVVIDPFVTGKVTLDLAGVPWDMVVRSVMEFQDANVTALPIGSVSLLTTRTRADQIRNLHLASWILKSERLGATELARALGAVRSESGLVLPNNRLQSAVVIDSVANFTNYARVLATIDAKPASSIEVPKPWPVSRYSGARVSWVFDEDLNAFLQRIPKLTKLRIAVDPQPAGVQPELLSGLFHAALADTAWDNAVDVMLIATDRGYAISDDVLRIEPLSGRLFSEVIVEAVPLRNDDPAFFLPLSKYLTKNGELRSEPQTRTLVIRDQSLYARRVSGWIRQIDSVNPKP